MRRQFKDLVTTRPGDVEDGDCFAVKIVAVVGYADDWAAYRGPSDWSDELVTDSGDKLLQGAAEPLFYVLRASGRHYRH